MSMKTGDFPHRATSPGRTENNHGNTGIQVWDIDRTEAVATRCPSAVPGCVFGGGGGGGYSVSAGGGWRTARISSLRVGCRRRMASVMPSPRGGRRTPRPARSCLAGAVGRTVPGTGPAGVPVGNRVAHAMVGFSMAQWPRSGPEVPAGMRPPRRATLRGRRSRCPTSRRWPAGRSPSSAARAQPGGSGDG